MDNEFKCNDFPQWDGSAKGQPSYRVVDKGGNEFTARRTLFNDSGWQEVGTNKQLFPTGWKDL